MFDNLPYENMADVGIFDAKIDVGGRVLIPDIFVHLEQRCVRPLLKRRVCAYYVLFYSFGAVSS